MDGWSWGVGKGGLGNSMGGAGLETTVSGPPLKFNADATICLTGAEMTVDIDGRSAPYGVPIEVRHGETLRMGALKGAGCRAYLAIRGGFDVPLYLGSRSTFTLGKFGGHGGRALMAGGGLHPGSTGGEWAGDPAAGATAPRAPPRGLASRHAGEW